MPEIADLLTPRDEVLKGEFQGVLQAHKVGGEEGRLESDPNRLLSTTYPSDSLRNIMDRVADALSGRDNQGGILLTGPYGSGKSHGLLVLYHMFNSPGVGQTWADEWDISIDLPDDTDAVILSTSETDADLIWEPIYRQAGREDLLEEIERYPTTEHIEALVGDRTLGVFFDEIETWWESFSTDADRDLLERNRFFLQNLLEVANDPEQDLFTFITLLDRSDRLKEILDRTSPHGEDLNATGDRERIIIHRLFERTPEDADESTIRDTVERYIDHYDYPIELNAEEKRYENRMVETYPFHPELLDLLDNIYEAARERQNVRGVMNVLADTVRDVYNETDIIVTADVSIRAFRGINRTLFDRFTSDKNHLKEDYEVQLLQTILLYTLDERSQMASTTECLIGTFKPDKTTVDRLHMSLEGLYGTAHYLDKQDESYFITEDPKLPALVAREQERILEEDREQAIDTLVDVVREDVFDDEVYVYGYDEIPDEKSQTFAVTIENKSNESLTADLGEFFEEMRYQNTVQFITPKKRVVEDDDLVGKSASVLGAERLRGKIEDEHGELEPLIRDERRQLRNELEDRYGKWVKWSSTSGDDDGLRMRRITVDPSVQAVRDKIGTDTTYIGEKIVDAVRENEGGIRVGSLRNDFLQFRRLPVLLDQNVFYSTVRKLQRNGDVVLEGDRANFYVGDLGEYPTEIEDEMSIYHPDHLPESVFRDESETTPSGVETAGTSTGTSIGTDTRHTTSGENDTGRSTTVGGTVTTEGSSDSVTDDTVATETIEIQLEGNSPRVLRSTAESRINGTTDTVNRLRLSYDLDEFSKEELLEFLESLPDAADIDATVVIDRVDDD